MTADQPAGSPVEPRFPPSSIPGLTGVRLMPGDMVELLDISRSGMLAEGRTRLVLGTTVMVTFEGTKPMRVKGKVVRCQVASIVDGALRYHTGVHFDEKIVWLESDPPAPARATAGLSREPSIPELPPEPQPRRVVNRW